MYKYRTCVQVHIMCGIHTEYYATYRPFNSGHLTVINLFDFFCLYQIVFVEQISLSLSLSRWLNRERGKERDTCLQNNTLFFFHTDYTRLFDIQSILCFNSGNGRNIFSNFFVVQKNGIYYLV